MPDYVPSIGMEVHAELSTRSKMFCRCPVAFGGEPNTRTCPICLGLPGALPVPNRAAVEMVLRTALALNCKIAMRSVFHRKNYFYPDLPKGYQVSQYGETNPIGYHGYLDIGSKRIQIRRVHLEEDTGKLMHLPSGGSGVDYNRAGVPLMEIVTEFPPDIGSPEEAKEYLSQLRQLLLFLGVCDGKMEQGSLRCEPNVSVRPVGSAKFGTKTELKNLSSFRSVQLGVAYEIRRQIEVLEAGGVVLQETRGWNEVTESSFVMRVKEEENDYRYFPDPDLVEMRFEESQVESMRECLPELPLQKYRRYRDTFGLSDYEANWLIAEPSWTAFFEEGVKLGAHPKKLYNVLSSDFSRLLNELGQGPWESKLSPGHFVDLLGLVESGRVSGKMGKALLDEAFASGRMPSTIAEESGAVQITDPEQVMSVVLQVIESHPEVVDRFKAGNVGVQGFLVGQVMKETGGRANPQLVQRLMKEALEK